MAKRESKLSPALKQQIRWLLGRVHVGESDEEAQACITRRMAEDKFTPGCIKLAAEYALKCHRDNQGLVKKYRL